MADAYDTASSLIIEEQTGRKRRLELFGRALPYRPVGFSGTMRAEVTFYPGNPVATTQIIGPTEKPTTMEGYWKDRFLDVTDSSGNVVEATGIAKLSGGAGAGNVTTAKDLVNLIDDIRRSGQLLIVTWDAIAREGFLTDFEQRWHNRHDVEWRAEFTWSSQNDPDPPAVMPQVDTSDFQAEAASLSQDLTSTVAGAQGTLAIVQGRIAGAKDFMTDLSAKVSAVESAVASVGATATQVVDLVLSPVDAARRVLAIVQYTKATAQDTMDAAQAHAYQSLTAPLPLNLPGSSSTPVVTPGRACATAKFLRNTRASARSIRSLSAQRGQEIASRIGDAGGIQVVIAKDGQDLRDISIAVYGSPQQWRLLKSYNGLTSSALTKNQHVLIPPQQRSTQSGG